MKRLALFLDGTWNKPEDNTNVWRLYTMVDSIDGAGNQQVAYYDSGVGTKWYDKLRGGALGTGLTGKVKLAYEWLVRNYDEGDEIFIFGFSRGAYTARSVAGIVSRCGLLLPGATTSVAEVFDRYRSEQRGRAPETQKVDINFIGVFDTVGALGIPGLSRKRYRFLNPHPSTTYKAMYHALAVDENRKPYRATSWTRWAPAGKEPDALKSDQALEQRWFVGVHSNVGGGYRGDELASVPIAWLQQNAVSRGLKFRRLIAPKKTAHMGEIRDSFGKFLGRLYWAVRLGRRYWRPIGAPPRAANRLANDQRGHSYDLNQVVDKTVFDRYQNDPDYRPENLIAWATQNDVSLSTTKSDTRAGTWIS